jgi:lysophospholipase L1-like esterase
MIYNNLEFHNVTELQKLEGLSGLRLQRFPEEIRTNLGVRYHQKGRIVSQTSTGCEIRFVTTSKTVRLYLSALDADGEVLVYNGYFFHGKYSLKSGVVTTLHLEKNERFTELKPEILEGYPFSHNVWRIFFSRGFSAVYHGIDTFGNAVRPPMESEVPKLKWLAYGSSITHGSVSLTHNNSYIEQAARRLGVDVMCAGLSGSCMCEKVLADHIASRGDWDFATLELGVNMRGPFNAEEFEAQTRYFITKVVESNPEKPVAVITIFPNRAEYFINEQDTSHIRNREFNEILEKICKELNAPNLHLIKGTDILTDFSALSCDLIHPSDYGHILMGENLANKLKNIVNAIENNK